MGARLLVEKKAHTAYLTIHHPEKRNALTPGLLMDMCDQLAGFSDHDDIRCVVITGSGDRVFSSGYDIGEIATEKASNGKQAAPDTLFKALAAVKQFPYPTIAKLNGHVFGAGFNLCACCDIRMAAEDIRMGMPPARIGLAYHPEGVRQFIDAFGLAVTKEIFYTARTFQGGDLVRKGLVNALVPRLDLEGVTAACVREIIANAPLSLKGIKGVIAMFEDGMALDQKNLEKADQLMQACFQSRDLKEGLAAIKEKRTPRFTGK